MKKRNRVPKKVEDIILDFSPKMETYECFKFARRLNIAYQAVWDVLGLSVLGATEKGSTKKRVTARRFICRALYKMHPDVSLKLLASAIMRDHATVIHYRKYDTGEKYNHYYSQKLPFLEAKFSELIKEQDFDLIDEGKLYTVEEIRRLMSRMFGSQITVKVTRASKRRDSGKRETRVLPIHIIKPNAKRSRPLVLTQNRSH